MKIGTTVLKFIAVIAFVAFFGFIGALCDGFITFGGFVLREVVCAGAFIGAMAVLEKKGEKIWER